MPESQQVALYALVGEAVDGNPLVYIGQSGDLRGRLSSHNKNKDFWDRAMVVISRTNSLTQTHALFLEWFCLRECRKAGRYTDENGNDGSRPHTPAPLEADCLEIFETAKILLSTLGIPIFETLAKKSESEVYFCKGSGTDGKGQYTSEGFVVLKGSKGKLELAPAIKGTYVERLRERLVESGVMKAEGDKAVFQKDHLFNSPSMAAISLLGRVANGWIEWKDKSSKTLDALKRQQPES